MHDACGRGVYGPLDADGVVHLGEDRGEYVRVLQGVVEAVGGVTVDDLDVSVSSGQSDWKIRYLGLFTFMGK